MKRFLPKSVSNFFQETNDTQPSANLMCGVIFGMVGFYIVFSALLFSLAAEPASLRVVAIESEIDDEGALSHRAVFEAFGEENRTLRYKSNTWSSFMPHEEGEVVPGKVNWGTGEIRSYGILKRDFLIGAFILCVASFCFYQGRADLRKIKWLPWNKLR